MTLSTMLTAISQGGTPPARFTRAIANVSDAASFQVALDAARDLSKPALAEALLDLREAFTGIPFDQRARPAEMLRALTSTLPAELKTLQHSEPVNRFASVEAVSRGENAAWVAAHLGFDKALDGGLQAIAVATSAKRAIQGGEDVLDVCRRYGITNPGFVAMLANLAVITWHRQEGDHPLLQQDLDLNARQKARALQNIEDLGQSMTNILVRRQVTPD